MTGTAMPEIPMGTISERTISEASPLRTARFLVERAGLSIAALGSSELASDSFQPS